MNRANKNSLHILTFDIEDWFHILDNDSTRHSYQWDSFPSRIEQNLFSILRYCDLNNIKATFFCLGWVAKKYPHLIKAISLRGQHIGSHSNNHQLAFQQSASAFRQDLQESLDQLEQCVGEKITSYRVPGFSFTEKNRWVYEILVEQGITIDSSILPAGRSNGGFPAFGLAVPTIIKTSTGNLKEFPINTFPMLGKPVSFSSGGNFRLLPYQIIRYCMRNSPYVMTYFHPRDFDSNQPRVPGLSFTEHFRSYVGIKSAWNKFDLFTKEFSLTDLREAEASLEWATSPHIDYSVPRTASDHLNISTESMVKCTC